MAAIASELLRVSRVAIAAAPGLAGIRCVVMREDDAGSRDAIYAGTFTRSLCSHSQSDSVNPESLAAFLESVEDVQINKRGRTGELCPLEQEQGTTPASPSEPSVPSPPSAFSRRAEDKDADGRLSAPLHK